MPLIPDVSVAAGWILPDEQTAYDASYLELASRRGLPLATLDSDLRAAAQRHGVTLL